MAADEPPYLTVGTDVSAKYKGAFCEAKIKKVNRSVKCKVTFKNSLGSSMIPDDQIRGTLRIGAEVEAVHPEKKQYLEAVVNKMQDCSQYTVVFDDGDETTLRRTSLCLKSGRHFAESPTLDQFPLTNPEHFSSPVVGTSKTKRKRRSTLNSATLDYYSSDEEIIPKKSKFTRLKEKDSDVGKVVCIDFGDRRKKDSWYPGVIVTNTIHSPCRINPKDEYLIRSFKDGKYNVVPKKDTREFSRDVCRKVDNVSLRNAAEKALLYFEKGELPAQWDKSYFGIGINLNEDDSQDTDSDSSDDEPSEEKDRFVAQLYKFMDERGTPINKGPTVGSHDLNLYKLFKVVHKMGGYNRVTNQSKWKVINSKMGFLPCNPLAPSQMKGAYKKYLHSFEDFYRKLGCTMVNNSRSTRGRHRSDRNFILTRNRDRDTASPKRKKEKIVEKKAEDKIPKAVVEKKETKIKGEINVKSEEKPKSSPEKKKPEKAKNEEKDEKNKPKKEENTKPRLVRSQSLNKDKREKTSPTETRNDRAKAREDAKKEKSESPEKKKETRSSAKLEQEREKREKEPVAKKSDITMKEKEEKPVKPVKEEKSSEKKGTAPAKVKKIERVTKEKEEEKVKTSDTNTTKDMKKDKRMDDIPPLKEKKFEVIKMDKTENTVTGFNKDKKERPREFKLTRLSAEFDEKPSRDKLFKDVRVQLNSEMFKENFSKAKAVKETVSLKDDSFVKILCEIKEEVKPVESGRERDLFDFSSTSGRSANDEEDDFTPGKVTKKRCSTAEEKEDVKSVIDMLEESDEEIPNPSSEKPEENKEVKAKNIEINDKVKVKYGHGRTQKVYEAKVLKIEMDGEEKRYYVHYAGWNTRYDEWVKKSFIVENISEHNRSVRRKKQEQNLKNSPPSPSKKSDRGRLPGTLPTGKLHRKNSTSSTNSSTVSNSRTTRSDKSGLHTSFSKGLQPRKRTRKKSGVSLTFTDTSQDSESDEDDSMLVDDEEDMDLEGEIKTKEDIFSDDDEIQLETFRKLPDKESQKTDDDEEPVPHDQEMNCETPEAPKAEANQENVDKELPEKLKITSVSEKKEEQTQIKVEHKPPEQNLPCFPPTTDDSTSFLKKKNLERKDSIDVSVPILKKVDEVIVESPRSISELIEMKYVEMVKKEPKRESVDAIKPQNIVDQPRKLLDDKMPPLITFMGPFDKVLAGTSIKTKNELCGATLPQSTFALSSKDKETVHDNKNALPMPLTSCSKMSKTIPPPPAKIELKSEHTPSPSKGYFPMFVFNSSSPKYSDSATDASNKSPLSIRSISAFSKNASDLKESNLVGSVPAKCKTFLFHEPLQEKPTICKEPTAAEKKYFPPLSKGTVIPTNFSSAVSGPTNLLGTISGPTNLSSTISGPTTLSSTISGPTTLSSTISGPTTLSSTISGPTTLSSTISGSTTLSSTISGPTTLSSAISGPTTLPSTISGPTTLSNTISSPTTLSSTIPGPTNLSSTIPGSTNLSSTIPGPTNLSSTISGPTNLSSTIAGPTNFLSNLSGPTNLSSNLSNLSSNLSGPTNLSSNLSGPTNLSSNFSGPTNLSSTVSGPTSFSSTVSGPTSLSSSISGPTSLLSSIPAPTNLSSGVPVGIPSNLSIPPKKVEKKKSYDTVIHNMPDFLQREFQPKCSELKSRTVLPESEPKVQRKPFEYSLTSPTKFRSIDNQSKSSQIDKYFTSFSSGKPLDLYSPSKSSLLLENKPEVKSNVESKKINETHIHLTDPFLSKPIVTDFDVLRNSNFHKKETVPVPLKPIESKEISTHTSVIAFASSSASTNVASPMSEIKRKPAEIKKSFTPIAETTDSNSNLVKDTDNKSVKIEKEKIEKPVTRTCTPPPIPPQQETASVDLKINSPELLQQSLTELSIEEKGKKLSINSKQNSPTSSNSSSSNLCNVFLNVSAEKSCKDVKELFSPQKNLDVKSEGDESVVKSVISAPSLKSSPDHSLQSSTHSASFEPFDSISSSFENEKSGSMFSRKEIKKKKSKISKKSSTFDLLEKEDKPKEIRMKSKKKGKLDAEDLFKAKDTEMKAKMKKFKKNKNKKRFSRLEDHDTFGKTDTTESGLKDASVEKIRKREKRKEKKFSKAESVVSKYDDIVDSKADFPKKDRKKGKKDKEKTGSDKKMDLCGKKIRKKKKFHVEGALDSDSEKDIHNRLVEKKKKEKKKAKTKDSSSSDDAAENRLLIDEEPNTFAPVQDSVDKREKIDDPDMSFLLCEEKVPASPVGANSLPDDTTGSSSLDENSNNRSPSSDEDRMPAVNLDIYPGPADLGMLENINKRNAEACAVLDNTPPTTPSSSPASIPSSSPSHDREPFLHYTESTQSGRESCGGESPREDSFRCRMDQTELTETEEYRAAATLAFAVGQSISGKSTLESCHAPPLKRQKSEVDEFSPTKRLKKSKRSYVVAEVSKVGNTRYKAASRSPRGESCDTYDSSNASIFTIASPPHGSNASMLCSSFPHHSSPQISTASDASSLRTSKSNLYLPLHEKDPEKRILILQEKMTDMKKLYASLKAEVAQIDRRRKKARKKIREAAASIQTGNTSAHGEDVSNCS